MDFHDRNLESNITNTNINNTNNNNNSPQFKFLNKSLKKSIRTQSLDLENEKINLILSKVTDNNKITKMFLKQDNAVNNRKINVNKSENSKYMGKNYNPCNYEVGYLKTTTRRNVFGSLYQH